MSSKISIDQTGTVVLASLNATKTCELMWRMRFIGEMKCTRKHMSMARHMIDDTH